VVWPESPRTVDFTFELMFHAASGLKHESVRVGSLLDNVGASALLIDVCAPGFPIVGASAGFKQMTGYNEFDLLGSNLKMFIESVPKAAVSRSGCKNLDDYIQVCSMKGVDCVAETTVVQPNMRKDGTVFINFAMFGRCHLQGQIYILMISRSVGEGLMLRLPSSRHKELSEMCRKEFIELRTVMQKQLNECESGWTSTPFPLHCLNRGVMQDGRTDFKLFAQRLQDHCILLNGCCTAVRREAHEITSSCLVFGDRPLSPTQDGLCFGIRVDDIVSSFQGYPVLGFTRKRPTDNPDLYPVVAKCLGQSLLIGGAHNEACARDQPSNFQMGFRQPPQSEIQTWCEEPDIPVHKRKKMPQLNVGDILQCKYGYDGALQLWVNGRILLNFQTQRTLDMSAEYYPVVDVCFTASGITVLQSQASVSAIGCMDRQHTVRPNVRGAPMLSPIVSIDGLDVTDFKVQGAATMDLTETVADGSSCMSESSPWVSESISSLPELQGESDAEKQERVSPESSQTLRDNPVLTSNLTATQDCIGLTSSATDNESYVHCHSDLRDAASQHESLFPQSLQQEPVLMWLGMTLGLGLMCIAGVLLKKKQIAL